MNKVNIHTQPRQKHTGLTLIEIMIAMFIGLILSAGLIQFFVGSKQAYSIQQAINGLQENGRYAMRVMSDSIHAADHWGGVGSKDVSGSPAVNGIGACNPEWILNAQEGIFGLEAHGANFLSADCVALEDYLDGTDAFVVRHAGGAYFSGAIASLTNNEIWVNTQIGRLSVISNGASINAVDQVGLYHYRYKISAYFVRPCSVFGPSKTSCDATADGGSPNPTLMRMTLDGNDLVTQSLVSGVEQMQLEYGIDEDGDDYHTADFYTTATLMNASQWAKVVSVRIGLIMRSDMRTPLADTKGYNLPGVALPYIPSADNQYYTRKLITRVIQIRNRSRS